MGVRAYSACEGVRKLEGLNVLERVWFAAARCEAGIVSIAAPKRDFPEAGDRARVLLMDASGPREWCEWAAGEFTVAAVHEKLARVARPAIQAENTVSGSLAVVVCTRERPALLASCLECLARLSGGAAEIIVVDNAPQSDSTDRVVRAAALRGVPVRRVVEVRRGLSRARNRALHETECDYVAFTDDDGLPDPDWARWVLAGFSRSEDAALVTGLVPPAELTAPAQAWFEERLRWSRTIEPCVYTIRRKGSYPWPFPYGAGHFGTGANFAVRRDIAIELGGFREFLGAGTRTQGGEDMEMFSRVVLAGHDLVFEPGAIVWHQHRPAEEDLKRVLFGYGKALSAVFLTNFIKGDRREVLKQNIQGLRNLIAERRLVLENGSPPMLVLVEIAGVLYGPFAFALERAASRYGSWRERPGVPGPGR